MTAHDVAALEAAAARARAHAERIRGLYFGSATLPDDLVEGVDDQPEVLDDLAVVRRGGLCHCPLGSHVHSLLVRLDATETRLDAVEARLDLSEAQRELGVSHLPTLPERPGPESER